MYVCMYTHCNLESNFAFPTRVDHSFVQGFTNRRFLFSEIDRQNGSPKNRLLGRTDQYWNPYSVHARFLRDAFLSRLVELNELKNAF